MKKFLRFFSSGLFFIVLALAIEVLIVLFFDFNGDQLLSTILALNNVDNPDFTLVIGILEIVFGVIRFIATIFAIVIFFKVINKFEDPEFKIPWLIFLFIFPVVTVTFFIIFADHGLPKKEKKLMDEYYKQISPFFDEHDKEIRLRELGNAAGAFEYINNTAHVGYHKNNRVTYYKTGEEFFPAFIEGLKKAKKFIFIEFFIVTDGTYWGEVQDVLKQKAQEGVDVRVIYDDLGCLGTISSRTPKKLRKFGIKCYKFHPFRPLLSAVFNNRDHRKIVVIDHQMAFTGGINLADEYGNLIERFGYWKDTMVKIEGSAIGNLISTFMANYALACKKVEDLSKFLEHDYKEYEDEGFVMPFGDGPGGIDDALIGEQNYINLLNYAKKEVFISTPYLIPTYSLVDALRNAAMRGVKVHLILPGIPDKKMVYKVAKSHFKPLLKAGVNIYLYTPGFNHMKTMLSDDALAFVGTINYDFRSLVHHFECGYKRHCGKKTNNRM